MSKITKILFLAVFFFFFFCFKKKYILTCQSPISLASNSYNYENRSNYLFSLCLFCTYDKVALSQRSMAEPRFEARGGKIKRQY